MLQQQAGNAAVVQAMKAAQLDVVPGPQLAELPAVSQVVEASSGADPAVLAEATQQQAAIQQAAVTAVAQIDATVLARQAALRSTFAAQQQQADDALQAHSATINAGTAANRSKAAADSADAVAGVSAEAETAITATGAAIDASEARTDAQSAAHADRGVSESADRATAARPANVTSDPDVGASQAKVADAVAGKAKAEVKGAAKRTSDAVREHTNKMKQGVTRPARKQAEEQIGSVAAQSTSAVTDAAHATSAQIGQLGGQAGQVARQAHASVAKALDAGNATAQQDLNTWAEQAKTRIRATSEQLGSAILAQGTELANRLARSRGARRATGIESASTALREAGTEATGSVTETALGLTDGAGDLADAHAQSVAQVGGQAARGLNSAATAATAASTKSAAAFAQHAATVRAAAGSELQQAPQRTSEGVAPHVDKGLADIGSTVDQAGQTQDSWVGNARSQGEAGTSRVESEAERLAHDNQPKQVQGLFDSFIASMRSWLKDKLGDVAGGIISGLILSIPTIIIAVALLAAGPVGWGVLAALIVVGIGLGIYNRFAEYSADHGGQGPSWGEGVGLVVLGALDITGIPYIVEAGYGQRAFAPKPMTDFESWERGTQGVVNLVLMFVGGGKKLFGGRPEIHPTVDPHGPVPVDPHAPPVVDPHAPVVDPKAPVVDPNAPAKPQSCFVPGTLVLTPDGPVPIEGLAVDSRVRTMDPLTTELSDHVVSHTSTAVGAHLLEIVIDGVTVTVTPGHPFWDVDRGWVPSESLLPGSGLLRADGKPVFVEQVSIFPVGRYTVHNLTVAGAHTYLVTELGVLVHNKGAAADPVGALRGHVQSLSSRVKDALRSAEAQPADTPGRDAQLAKLREIQKAIDQLQKESNGSDPDVDDLGDWANDLDNDLHPIEQKLPEPQPVNPAPAHVLTSDGAFQVLQGRRLWQQITADHPGRSWTAKLGEEMTSNTPHETKQKLYVTGSRAGEPPVKVEVSVIFDRNTGRFEDMHLSSGKSAGQ